MILHSRQWIDHYVGEGRWGQRTLLDQFAHNRDAHPDREAVVDPPDRPDLVGTPARSLSYEAFGRAVDATAAELIRRGLAKDDIVVAQLPNIWELAMLYLAVARAGGVLTALPLQWRATDVGYVAELTGARLYIAADHAKGFDYIAMGRTLGFEQCLSLAELTAIAEGPVGPLPPVTVDANDIFTLCWTSGTESRPKGCPMSHNSWFSHIGPLMRTAGLREGDRQLCVAPLVNMTALGVNYVSWLVSAGTLVLHHPLTMPVLLEQLSEQNIHFTILVPAVLNMIAKLPDVDRIDLSSVRAITTGSAPPSLWTLEEFKRRWGIEIINIWGQNEGTCLIAGPADVPELERRVGHLPFWGKPGCRWPSGVDGVRVKLLDDEDREVTEPGGIGELCYRAPSLFAGYFKRPDLTEKAFTADGYFRTGDLFVIRDDAHVGFHDRKKDMVIRGGFNISSAEVENAVQAHPAVLDAAVIPQPDEVMGEQVCVCVVAREPASPPTLDDITGFLRESGMSLYKLPEALRIVDAIPRNPVGKILKRRLRDEVG